VKRNLLILAVVGASLVACGKTGSPMLNAIAPTAEDTNAAKNAAAPAAATPADAPNSAAIGIQRYYFDFLHAPIESKVNVFQSNMAAYTPTVEIEADVEVEAAGPTTPLQYYDTDSYKLVLIMSGTATPKALVSDPQSKSYVITVDTPIGNRNGRVVSISGSEVRIEEPGFPPVVKSLQSDRDEMIKELQSNQEF
jgi:hypothetical protein